jgi:hypothetical protein
MNNAEHFDDLARRKLDERTFPFDEGHWQAMQQVLAAERRRKRRGLYWGLAAGLLLLIGGGVALLRSDDAITAPPVAEVHEEVPATAPNAPTNTPAAPSTVQQPATAPQAASSTGPMQQRDTSDAPTAAASTEKPSGRPAQRATTATPANRRPATPPRAISGTNDAAPKARDAQRNDQPVGTAAAGGTGTTATADLNAAPAATLKAAPKDDGHPGGAVPAAGATAAGGNTLPPDTARTAYSTSEDPHETAPKPVANGHDSLPPATAQPAAPPVIPPASPWELTVWGGVQRTNSTYSGAEVPWSGTISDATAPAFGAEVMHMGRNIGLGAGLHYITYAERYQQPGLYTDIVAIDPVYSLIQVDTSLLFVTGSYTQNGQVYYTTELMDTFIYVLDVSADTTVTRVTTQQGVDRVNQVSYLELPLFVDGHLDAGRWRFGLRGGPTVGLLTGRRGAMPIIDPSGVINLEDQPFREYMFGWTMRGYVRYRLGERWWLGVEPMMRGQLMNAYSTGSLERRSTGMGIGFSVSWRLP